MSLNAIRVGNLKPKNADYRVADGGGLYLLVRPTGSKLFRYDYRLNGTRRTLSIGEYAAEGDGVRCFTLKQARDEHEAARAAIARGEHPVSPAQRAVKAEAAAEVAEQARLEAADRTFGALADEWLAARRVGNSPKTVARDVRSVAYLKGGYRGAKGFGDLDVAAVETAHLSALAEKFNKPTRIRVISAARKIMAVAKRRGWIKHSPFSDVNFNEGLPKHREKKRPAITEEKRFGALLREIDGYEGRGNNLTWYGLKLLALTFVRPDTMAKAEWKHFDLSKARWVIPFEALKMEWLRTETGEALEDFTVPLSRQAVALLRELHKITGKGRYLFPACGVGPNPGEVMSENTLNYALHSLGYKGIHCAHGFRSSASTILNRQRTPEGRRVFERSLVELQLDHQDSSTRAKYDRDDCMPEREELMQYWADLIDTLRDGGRSKARHLKAVA
ncbi:integrase arm-type DNA-binding domain-containing protein [Bradyrhizobium sp. BRP22]|uniref:tyrosine-type recombinase/integrase n=1 Tax=Bradyrhizobium sp. BRP22 TaxID=2793821 RepID=UPI001CD363D9|nr:integrase arm-type DNA-binding domain-containing protein [Bradyrhizobium sp. BRP22]MCA1453974.1 integrase arm-type DNA-binding domain-containing protein [Bradyrhizobium sp. BRP22]